MFLPTRASVFTFGIFMISLTLLVWSITESTKMAVEFLTLSMFVIGLLSRSFSSRGMNSDEEIDEEEEQFFDTSTDAGT